MFKGYAELAFFNKFLEDARLVLERALDEFPDEPALSSLRKPVFKYRRAARTDREIARARGMARYDDTLEMPKPCSEELQLPHANRWRRRLFLVLAISFLLWIVIVLPRMSTRRNDVAITNISDGSAVGHVQVITGTGWKPRLNNYLVVEKGGLLSLKPGYG